MSVHDAKPIDHDLEIEALVRFAAARDLLAHVCAGDVFPEPWARAARGLVEIGEEFLRVAA